MTITPAMTHALSQRQGQTSSALPLSVRVDRANADKKLALDLMLVKRHEDQREKDQYTLSIMFLELGVPQPVIHAIIYDQQYDDPVALSRLMSKKVEQLVAAIRWPGGIKGGERDPRINVPLRTQELITDACFALKDQRRRGYNRLDPLLITLSTLDLLRLQMEIEAAHDNNAILKNRPKWDPHNRAASADLIEEHFQQLRGIEGVPCTYLMQEQMFYKGELFADLNLTTDQKMIQDYPIVAYTFRTNVAHWAMDQIPLLKFYTPEAAEDNVFCYCEFCRIVEGTEAQVYVDEFKLDPHFRAAWFKLYNREGRASHHGR